MSRFVKILQLILTLFIIFFYRVKLLFGCSLKSKASQDGNMGHHGSSQCAHDLSYSVYVHFFSPTQR